MKDFKFSLFDFDYNKFYKDVYFNILAINNRSLLHFSYIWHKIKMLRLEICFITIIKKEWSN